MFGVWGLGFRATKPQAEIGQAAALAEAAELQRGARDPRAHRLLDSGLGFRV